MSSCWSAGALRAYQDRELSPEDMELAAAHLAECAECAEMSKALAARAARVADRMDALPEPEFAPDMPARIMPAQVIPAIMPAPRRLTAVRRIGLAAALAAGLVLAAAVAARVAAILGNRHGDPTAARPVAVVPSPPARAVADTVAVPDTTAIQDITGRGSGSDVRAVAQVPSPRQRVRRSQARQPAPQAPPRQVAATSPQQPAPTPRAVPGDFLALDDDPIETGVVMRVGVEPGNVQADIVFGQDGRAHAIRLVNARK